MLKINYLNKKTSLPFLGEEVFLGHSLQQMATLNYG